MVKVLLFGELEALAGTSEVMLPKGRVMDVLASLSSLYGQAFRDFMFGDESGRKHLIILVNNAPVRYNVYEYQLADEDTVSLMPMDEGE